MTKPRVRYYDIAKGILILLVLIGHTDNVAILLGIHNEAFANIKACQVIWVSFYMPAFFLITGCCSNFNNDFKPFLISNIKLLLIPSFTLKVINCWLPLLFFDGTIPYHFGIDIISFAFSGGAWFLASLFLAKVGYWWINKYFFNNLFLQLIITTIFFFIGCLLFCSNIISDIGDFWSSGHALILMFFLPLGRWVKNRLTNRLILISIGIYLVTLILYGTFCENIIPFITWGIVLTYSGIIPLYILSITGSLALLGLCKLINEFVCFEYLGRYSLIIYCTHIGILKGLYAVFRPVLVNNELHTSYVIWIISLVITIMLSLIIAKLLNIRPLSFLIGKF